MTLIEQIENLKFNEGDNIDNADYEKGIYPWYLLVNNGAGRKAILVQKRKNSLYFKIGDIGIIIPHKNIKSIDYQYITFSY